MVSVTFLLPYTSHTSIPSSQNRHNSPSLSFPSCHSLHVSSMSLPPLPSFTHFHSCVSPSHRIHSSPLPSFALPIPNLFTFTIPILCTFTHLPIHSLTLPYPSFNFLRPLSLQLTHHLTLTTLIHYSITSHSSSFTLFHSPSAISPAPPLITFIHPS